MKGQDFYDYMKQKGFTLENNGSGMWYTKQINYKGIPAILAITDVEGVNAPEDDETPIMIGVYDNSTKDNLIESYAFNCVCLFSLVDKGE